VKNGTNMPNVNTFGGCDPFVEVRCVKGDPQKKGGGITDVPKDAGRTKSRDGDLNPTWNETLTLNKASFGQEKFVQIILWDANIAKNTPIGYFAINTPQLLSGLQYDPQAAEPAVKDYTPDFFHSVLEDKSMALTAVVNLSFSYLEMHKFKINVKKCSHLPKVDSIGSIDAFVEVRLVEGDPRQMEYKNSAGPETKWSGKTKVINDNMDPTFNEDISFTYPANPALNLIVVVADSGTLGNTPIGMVVIPFRQICSNANGSDQVFKSKLEKMPNWAAPDKLKLSTVSFSVSHDLAMES